MRRKEDTTRSAPSSKSESDEGPSFDLVDFTPTSTALIPTTTAPLQVRPHTIHGTRNSIFRPDALGPIIESSPRSENPTLPPTPRSLSASLKLNDGHSPASGSGGKSLPPTPCTANDAGLPTPPATIHTSSTSTHTRQSSVHSVAGTAGTFGEDQPGQATGHSDDATTATAGTPGSPSLPNVRSPVMSNTERPHSSWHPDGAAAPQYTPSEPLFAPSETPTLRESPSQITLLSERDQREAETAHLKNEVRRLAEAMAAFDSSQSTHAFHHPHAHFGHAHSHSLPNVVPNGIPNAQPQHQEHQQPPQQHRLQPNPNNQVQVHPNNQLQRHVLPPTVVPGFHPMQAGFMPFMAFWPPPQPQYIPCQCASQVQTLKGQLAELASAVERLDFRPSTPPTSPPKYRVRRPLPPRPVSSPPPAATTPTTSPSGSGTSVEIGSSSVGTSTEETSSGASETTSRRASESSTSKK